MPLLLSRHLPKRSIEKCRELVGRMEKLTANLPQRLREPVPEIESTYTELRRELIGHSVDRDSDSLYLKASAAYANYDRRLPSSVRTAERAILCGNENLIA